MIYTVQKFCEIIEDNGFNTLANEVRNATARPLDDNAKASYSKVSVMLTKAMKKNPAIGDCHIAVDTSLLLEYKLPSASAWCDLVLLGKNAQDKNQVVIIELKNWMKNNTDKPGIAEGLMEHKGELHSHPSDQVRGYTEYCQRFHSAVQDYNADCCGLVYFTTDIDMAPYAEYPNNNLVKDYPTFNSSSADKLADMVADKVRKSDAGFAKMFVDGVYKQDRSILRQVAELFSNKEGNAESPFVLLGPQRRGHAEVMKHLQDTVECIEENAANAQKQVIIVEGPPGSGKSAVAINIWADAALQYTKNERGNCVFVTTSVAQDENWRKIFAKTRKKGAKWLIQKSTAYHAGLSPQTFNDIVPTMREDPTTKSFFDESDKLIPTKYKEIADYLIAHKLSGDYKDNAHLISVVDEAHALINPFSPDFIGNYQAWPKWMGPQAYHIIRQSQVSVFFTDVQQSFREYESTSVQDIEEFAKMLGANLVKVSLAGMQFRCSGSVDYVDWVDNLFSENPIANYNTWKDQYNVEIFDWPSEVEDALRKKMELGDRSARLLSSYTKKWVSKEKVTSQHRPGVDHDFVLSDKDGREFRKYWNTDYNAFVQNAAGSTMSTDPLSEVGCPYVARGFDFSWVGLLWLKDFIYRENLGGWCISSKYVEETAIKTIKSGALKEWNKLPVATRNRYTFEGEPLFSATMVDCPMIQRLIKAQAQAYRILMTRAMKGLCIYIEDEETRNYVRSLLKLS